MSSHGWNREKLCWNCDPIVNCVTVTCRLIQPMRGFAAMNVPIVLNVLSTDFAMSVQPVAVILASGQFAQKRLIAME